MDKREWTRFKPKTIAFAMTPRGESTAFSTMWIPYRVQTVVMLIYLKLLSFSVNLKNSYKQTRQWWSTPMITGGTQQDSVSKQNKE